MIVKCRNCKRKGEANTLFHKAFGQVIHCCSGCGSNNTDEIIHPLSQEELAKKYDWKEGAEKYFDTPKGRQEIKDLAPKDVANPVQEPYNGHHGLCSFPRGTQACTCFWFA